MGFGTHEGAVAAGHERRGRDQAPHPVFAGQRLEYVVTRTHQFEGLLRFQVEAHVAGKLAAKGVMTSTHGVRLSATR